MVNNVKLQNLAIPILVINQRTSLAKEFGLGEGSSSQYECFEIPTQHAQGVTSS